MGKPPCRIGPARIHSAPSEYKPSTNQPLLLARTGNAEPFPMPPARPYIIPSR